MEAKAMSDIYTSIVALAVIALGVVIAYFKGSKSGSDKQKIAQQAKDDAESVKIGEVRVKVAKSVQESKEMRNAQADSAITDSLIADSVRKQDNP